MFFTIDKLLQKNNLKLQDTIYANDSSQVRNFIISAGDFFHAVENPGDLSAYVWNDFEEISASSINDEMRIQEIQKRLKVLKNDEEDKLHQHADEIKRLREEKKQLNYKMKEKEQPKMKGLGIQFKNCLYATSFSAIKKLIPRLSSVNFPPFGTMPLFTKNIEKLAGYISLENQIGISGGPCLFGVNEMLVELVLDNGDIECFDFSSGRNHLSDGEYDLSDALAQRSTRVAQIRFINQKRGVTSQEYDSLHCLFEFAHALNAKLAIPIPDMSYIKFFTNIVSDISVDVAGKAIEAFRTEAFVISDMYLAVIAELSQQYPDVDAAVIHERDEIMCGIFYENRNAFLTPAIIRRLTDIRGKTDAILDYITMPALPFYIWGIKNIIQMDSLDETDSYRKCCKIHKGCLNLCAMLYPEPICADGENTVFYAPLKFKEYRV